jgi:cytosine/adenosine deaminase-related metal-dependent hydrolase
VPAGLLGLERGRIAPGMPADLVVLEDSLATEGGAGAGDAAPSTPRPTRVMVGGRWLSLEAS